MSDAPGPGRPRLLVVAQAFKGTFTVDAVATAIAAACREVTGSIRTIEGSDGGDGLLEAVGASLVRRSQATGAGPLGEPVRQDVGWLDDRTAIVESRLWCGLSLVPPALRAPLRTSTRGVGEVVAQLVAQGADTILVGLGGSASVDGGTGFARALGWEFRDAVARSLPEGGGSLARIDRVRGGQPLGARLVALADVTNPLTGPAGAAVYAPQKGAGPADVAALSEGLSQLVSVLGRERPRAISDAALAGAGAAGGLGFGLVHFGDASLVSGAEWVLGRAGFDAALREADVVVTGEGRFDATSLSGKLTGHVLRRAQAEGIPVVLLAPEAVDVPAGVVVESGGGPWTLAELGRRAARAVRAALRLPLP